jgi:hypothetical protein
MNSTNVYSIRMCVCCDECVGYCRHWRAWYIPFRTPMIVLFGDGTVGLLPFRKFRCNKQRQNERYVFPNGIDHNHVQFLGDFIFCEGCKYLERFYTPVCFLLEIYMTTFSQFLYFRWKSVLVVSKQLLAQLTDIRETCCEHNACEDPPKGF